MDGYRVFGALVAVLLASSPDVLAEGPRSRAGVVLHMHDASRVSADDLVRARAEVERVFKTAGIELSWVPGGLPEASDGERDAAPEVRHVAVMLVASSGQVASVGGACVLGVAVPAVSRAYVFHDQIRDIGRRLPIDRAIVLGRVIAHEVGHLLLPTEPHSSYGVMRASLDLAYRNPGRFTDAQARRIREVLTSDFGR